VAFSGSLKLDFDIRSLECGYKLAYVGLVVEWLAIRSYVELDFDLIRQVVWSGWRLTMDL
jgi:hypothetical protein